MIKVLFLIMTVMAKRTELVIKRDTKKGKTANLDEQRKKLENEEYLRTRLELMFKFTMSIFLIIVFFPKRKSRVELTYEDNLLLTVFGFILLITADWSVLIPHNIIEEYMSKALFVK
ncbi:MAG: hypothetical protein CMP00_05570 [Woeseiaceae bacterium]|nr:hypothetical protein [Woeseiaceae bacterium]|tara:strand:+ start:282 stop:632 length:351 start_codon:yes stop_codon:yes gene_type:complete